MQVTVNIWQKTQNKTTIRSELERERQQDSISFSLQAWILLRRNYYYYYYHRTIYNADDTTKKRGAYSATNIIFWCERYTL